MGANAAASQLTGPQFGAQNRKQQAELFSELRKYSAETAVASCLSAIEYPDPEFARWLTKCWDAMREAAPKLN